MKIGIFNSGRIGLFAWMVLPALILQLGTAGCKNHRSSGPDKLTLTIFHAGSLSVPLKSLAEAFEKENPGVKIRMEAAGSLACVRKLTELHQNCDVLALADYQLIDEHLIPEYATWNLRFAANEICLAYTEGSRMADVINRSNWYDILSNPDIRYGRSDPDADPCGYRTVLALQLASLIDPEVVNWQQLLKKDTRFIRGKETDLNALLESKTIDYMFNYRSVAVQHGFKTLLLSDSVNLSDPDLDEWYARSSVEVRGTTPGSRSTQTGAAIIYGLTIPSNAPNPDLAKRFIRMIADPNKGRILIESSGQKAITPTLSGKSVAEPKFLKN